MCARLVLATTFLSFLVGCQGSKQMATGGGPTTSTVVTQADIIGTWRMSSVVEGLTKKVHPVTAPFFIRFYEDSSVATWPTPSRPVSRGHYDVKDGKLHIPETPEDVILGVAGDKLWYTNTDGDTCYYYRIRPDLQPGQFR